MPVTALDPKTALIVIDLQKLIVGLPTAHPMAGILAAATALTDAFRRRGLPVVLVNATGIAPGRTQSGGFNLQNLPPDWADLVPELNAQPTDLLVTKKTWGAFTNTDLEARLEGAWRHAGRGHRRRHQHGRGIDRAPRARTRLQRHAGDGRHDRHEPRSARQQRRQDFSASRRDRARPQRFSRCSSARELGRQHASAAFVQRRRFRRKSGAWSLENRRRRGDRLVHGADRRDGRQCVARQSRRRSRRQSLRDPVGDQRLSPGARADASA